MKNNLTRLSYFPDSLANLLLQAQRKAYYNDELVDLLTSVEELRSLTQASFWQRFAEKMTTTIQQIIEFAKLTPGFTQLSQDDQIMILKGGKKMRLLYCSATQGRHCG